MTKFADTTILRTDELTEFVKKFDEEIKGQLQNFKFALDKIGDNLLKSIQDNLNPTEYKVMLDKITRISASLETGTRNLSEWGAAITSRTEQMDGPLAKSITGMSATIEGLKKTMHQEIPNALQQAIETSERIVRDSMRQMIEEQRQMLEERKRRRWNPFRNLFRRRREKLNTENGFRERA
jgi:hypothetical protein